jgi:hypothetical protein
VAGLKPVSAGLLRGISPPPPGMTMAECVTLRLCGLDEKDAPDALEAALRRQFEAVVAVHFLPPPRRSRLMLNGGAALLIVGSRVCARKILAASKKPSFRLGGSKRVQIEWADDDAGRVTSKGSRGAAKEEPQSGDRHDVKAEGDAGGQLQRGQAGIDLPDKSKAGEGSTSGSGQWSGQGAKPAAAPECDMLNEATSSRERCILPQKRKMGTAGYSWAHPDLEGGREVEDVKRPRVQQGTSLECAVLSPRGLNERPLGCPRQDRTGGHCVSRALGCQTGVAPAPAPPMSLQGSPRPSPAKVQQLRLSSLGQSPKVGAGKERNAFKEIGNLTPRLANRQRSCQERSPLKSPLQSPPPCSEGCEEEGKQQEYEVWRVAWEVMQGEGWQGGAVGRDHRKETQPEPSWDTTAIWVRLWPRFSPLV